MTKETENEERDQKIVHNRIAYIYYIYDVCSRLHDEIQMNKNDLEKIKARTEEVLNVLYKQFKEVMLPKLGPSIKINEGNGPWNITMIMRESWHRREFIYFASEISNGRFLRFIKHEGQEWEVNHDL